MQEKRYIDLHTHTNNSDGAHTPLEVIDYAAANKTKILAISDHDSIAGLDEFRENIQEDMIGINGVEFSSFIDIETTRFKLHILGYGFDETNPKMQALLKEMIEKRRDAHIKFLKDLRRRVERVPESVFHLNLDRYCWFDREVIECFEKRGYSEEKIQDLKKYYNENKFSYGMDYNLDIKKVIDAIKSAGGYVVFAHPMAYGMDKATIEEVIENLVYQGIDGIEIYQSDCSIQDTIWLNEYAKKYDLFASVGSDFHTINSSDKRHIATGINENLCVERTTLTDKILEEKKYFKRR